MRQRMTRLPIVLVVLGLMLPFWAENPLRSSQADTAPLTWTHLSTATGDLPLPSASTEQTVALILDIDRDGRNDFVIASRREPGPAVVWYRWHTTGWTKYLIEANALDIEAGGAYYDIDGDGDLDLVMGGDWRSNQVWWWENPHPVHNPSMGWTRRLIKNSGSAKHHDQMFGDFDGDGQAELIFWNQRGKRLFLAEIPADPSATQPWPATVIFTWEGETEHEGLAQADMDGDGKIDIVGGGYWFKHEGGTSFTPHLIDDQQYFSRAAAGQLKAGGRPEVVFGAGDWVGPLRWYEWNGQQWLGHDLLGHDIDHGHSLAVVDFNQDGHLDIFAAEMRLNGGNSDAKLWIFLGDSTGQFTKTEVATGFDSHEAKVGDLDGDGDLDILGKPYNHETPRLDIWLNNSQSSCRTSLAHWRRHVLDGDKPWRSIFVTTADVTGDGHIDILTGGWWYQNPGVPGGAWVRHAIGTPLNNLALVEDLDGDGSVDVLGTGGQGSEANASFVWARNNGTGSFTLLNNIAAADGDFLQGVASGRFQPEGPREVVLSWHDEHKGLQALTVPADPVHTEWPWRPLSPVAQGEALGADDIDRDGDLDLLLGTQWLRNEGGTPPAWQPFTLHPTADMPDRNRLVDMNGDGRLDAVVSYEVGNRLGKVAWYEQPSDATLNWTEHLVALVINPLSLDVADMNDDGHLDVVVGEHNTANPASARLFVFENGDGRGTTWHEHLVHTGDEHHDGAQVVDIDGDGDLDIVSIGWNHNQVLLYENTAPVCGDGGTTPTPIPTSPPPTATPPAPTTCGGRAGLQALYTFQAGSGTTIHDVSGVGEPLPLVIQDATYVAWLPGGGLAVQAPTLIASTAPATKLIQASQATQAFTLEAWVRPADTTLSGPARIVTLSQDLYQRNFTLGQDLSSREQPPFYDVRVRTTDTDLNGRPSLATSANVVTTTLTHVVYTLETGAQRKIYVDGVEVAADLMSGDLTNWNPNYFLALGNELTGDRPWLGEYHWVALYHCAFSASEVAHQFAAGPQAPLQQTPVASFTAEPSAGTAPLNVHFDATASSGGDGVVQAYTWDFGDGGSGTGATAQHEYTVSGTYTVTLTVMDQHGGRASTTQRIQVTPSNEVPQARFTTSAVLGNVPLPVHFDASSTTDDGTIITYAWDFGDGITAMGMTVSHAYTSPGSYAAMLTVTDDGGLSSSASVTIAVGIEPTAPIIIAQPVDALVALGDRVTFAVTATGAEPLAYQWYHNGADIPGATAPIYTIPTVTAADQGALFTCVVTNVAGSITSQAARLTIRANREPIAQFTTSATIGGAPLLVHFDARASSDVDGTITTYTWDFGDGTTATGVTVSHTYSTPGIYVVTLTITDDQGATARTSTTIQVDILPVPPIIIEQPADVVVTEGEQATFVVTAAGTLPLFYQWQRDGVDIVGATTSSYTIPAVTSADQGALFSCVVTNGTGSTTTRGAVLTIIPPQSGSVQLLYLPLVTR